MNVALRKRDETEGSQPLYIQLAQSLAGQISSGSYAVGSLLPTEAELGDSFGVSRYTVRQAIQHLRQQGLVSARKGVGTRVEAQGSEARYSQSLQSLRELLQYAHETRLDLVKLEQIQARGGVAEMLGCRPRKTWLHIAAVRHTETGPHQGPVCLVEIYLDTAYRDLATDISSLRTAFWSLIEQRFGETIVEVEQQIDAVVLDETQAEKLKAPVGSPALQFTRRYFVTGRRLVELSINVHPADRFSYNMNIRRDLG
jgi:GntR family transcriptional regulator